MSGFESADPLTDGRPDPIFMLTTHTQAGIGKGFTMMQKQIARLAPAA